MNWRKHIPRYGPALAFMALAAAVLAPVLSRGYVLTLDMVFTPHLRWPAGVSNDYLFLVLLHALNWLLPGDIIEKLILFLILTLSGLGMYRLVQTQAAGHKPDLAHLTGSYAAGILYTINPYTYDRLMAGQYQVLFGYALLPWFGRSLLAFLNHPDRRRTANLVAWALVTSIISVHAIGFMAVLAAVAAGLAVWRQRSDRTQLRAIGTFGLLSVGVFLLASSYWLVPLGLGQGTTAAELSSFTTADQTAFQTLGGNLIGRIGNVLRLQGFWAEGQNLYNLPQDQTPFFELLAGLIWVFVIAGGTRLWRRRQRSTVLLFAIVGCVGVVLGIGSFNGWLTAHVPFFAGYREPEKFVALVALGFAVFAGEGVSAMITLVQRSGDRLWMGASALALTLPLVWTSVMLWAGGNQLVPVEYPAGWFAVNARLDADHQAFQTLFLPWHLYMYFDFEGRIIANPAPQFFDKPMIISNDPQFAGVPPLPNQAATGIGAVLAAAGHRHDLPAGLAPYHVKYIVLARDDDYANYGYLSRQHGLRLVVRTRTMELYQVENFGGN